MFNDAQALLIIFVMGLGQNDLNEAVEKKLNSVHLVL